MQFFVSYEIVRDSKIIDCGSVVIEAATPADITASVEAIKNDAAAVPNSRVLSNDSLRVLCFTALPSSA